MVLEEEEEEIKVLKCRRRDGNLSLIIGDEIR